MGREKGRQVIWLGVWEGNVKAIDFYTQWGFKKFSEHIFMLGDEPQTDWLMKKSLL
jgi:ribosomal protein S18 acetylase RimI-like enzyme